MEATKRFSGGERSDLDFLDCMAKRVDGEEKENRWGMEIAGEGYLLRCIPLARSISGFASLSHRRQSLPIFDTFAVSIS